MAKADRKVVYSTDSPQDPDSPFAELEGRFGAAESSERQTVPPRAAVSKPPAKVPAAAVRVQRERKGRGGKTVSVITGVPGPEARRLDLLKQLKQKLGAGGVLEGDNIVIQGDHRDRVVDILNQMGYRAKVAGG